jgi:hypothetical protein
MGSPVILAVDPDRDALGAVERELRDPAGAPTAASDVAGSPV